MPWIYTSTRPRRGVCCRPPAQASQDLGGAARTGSGLDGLLAGRANPLRRPSLEHRLQLPDSVNGQVKQGQQIVPRELEDEERADRVNHQGQTHEETGADQERSEPRRVLSSEQYQEVGRDNAEV